MSCAISSRLMESEVNHGKHQPDLLSSFSQSNDTNYSISPDECDTPNSDSRQPPNDTEDHDAQFPYEFALSDTRTRYTYAAGFLLLSLISFAIQTETAVYIQTHLHWSKAYSMLYLTHGSWILLWPFQLIILRLQQWHLPWKIFWRKHIQTIKSTAQMIEKQSPCLTVFDTYNSSLPYLLRTVAIVTCTLTIAATSWYVAVNMTTASDLTAIYNCSAFFAYAFSIPILKEELRKSKIIAVIIAIFGVLFVAYGGVAQGGKIESFPNSDTSATEPQNISTSHFFGNVIIGIGSVLYGFYEVLYKRLACPPNGTTSERGIIFANTFGSLIGLFTLLVLWIPLPIIHYLDIETFEPPKGDVAWVMLLSITANVVFSGSFLVLISLTSPALSSVASLLTIFLVALIGEILPGPFRQRLTLSAVTGGILITIAFLILSWATYREMTQPGFKTVEETWASDLED